MKKKIIILFNAIALCCSMAMASIILPADVNNDGIVSKEDATLIYNFICGTADASITADMVDVNSDGKVNTADVVEVYLKLKEIENNIPYLTFSANETQTMTVKIKGTYTLDESLEYSVNNSEWTTLSTSTPISFGGDYGTLRMRGKSSTGMATDFTKYAQITFESKNISVACSGDIRTLVDYTNYSSADTNEARFCYLFNGCTSLTSAPELPSDALAERCYYGMFYGCTNLTSPPALPATSLKASCYYSMFYGCTGLTSTPSLSADTLADMCYYNMFYGCKSLITAHNLPATTLAKSCYANMFYGCTSLTTAPTLPATSLEANCYEKMFYGCSSLATAPALPATTLAEKCYYYMFRDCTALTTASELPATTLAKSCYEYMFYGCTGLETTPTILATTVAEKCCYGMFYNCTGLTTATPLHASTLAEKCYYYMFRGCTSLNSITMLATDISASGSLTNWVDRVATIGTFFKAAQIEESAFSRDKNGIPSGWAIEDYNIKESDKKN